MDEQIIEVGVGLYLVPVKSFTTHKHNKQDLTKRYKDNARLGTITDFMMMTSVPVELSRIGILGTEIGVQQGTGIGHLFTSFGSWWVEYENIVANHSGYHVLIAEIVSGSVRQLVQT